MDIQALYTYLRPNLDRVEARIDTSLRSDIALLDGIKHVSALGYCPAGRH